MTIVYVAGLLSISGAARSDKVVSFFVAVNGSDNAVGNASSPFRTLRKAQLAVQELVASNATFSRVEVNVRSGTYYLNETLHFSAPYDCSSTGDYEVLWTSASPLEQVTLSGGVPLTAQWQIDASTGLASCPVPENQVVNYTELFVNGMRQHRARFPNYDFGNPLQTGSGYTTAVNGTLPQRSWPGLAPISIEFNSSTFTNKNWSHPSNDATLFIFPWGPSSWGNLIYKIDSVNRTSNSIYLAYGGWQHNTLEFYYAVDIRDTNRFYVEGIREELDSVSEWFLDSETGAVEWYPPQNIDLGTAESAISSLDRLMHVQGCSNFRINGFNITHVAPTFLNEYEVLSMGDITVHKGGAIVVENCKSSIISNCTFDQVGGNAVCIRNENDGIEVKQSRFVGAGDNGVLIVGNRWTTVGTNYAYPRNCAVTDCTFNLMGRYGKQVTGVTVSNAHNITISHNWMQNLPHSGIIVNDGIGAGHTISFNHFYNTVRDTSDRGPIKLWGRERNWCYQWSHIDDSPSPRAFQAHSAGFVKIDAIDETQIYANLFEHGPEQVGPFCIDHDDGTSHVAAFDNICVGNALKIRDGDYRRLMNNLIVDSYLDFRLLFTNNSDIITNNVVLGGSSSDKWLKLQYNEQPILPATMNFNCIEKAEKIEFWNNFDVSSDLNVTQWLALGHDLDSVFAESSHFIQSYYYFAPTSPCLLAGFKNIEQAWGVSDIDRKVLPVRMHPFSLAEAPASWVFVNGSLVNAKNGMCLSLPVLSTEASLNVELHHCLSFAQGMQKWKFSVVWNVTVNAEQKAPDIVLGVLQPYETFVNGETEFCLCVKQNSRYFYPIIKSCDLSSVQTECLWAFPANIANSDAFALYHPSSESCLTL